MKRLSLIVVDGPRAKSVIMFRNVVLVLKRALKSYLQMYTAPLTLKWG